MPKFVIFDLDGVLADSTPMVEVAWRQWCAEAGLDPEPILRLAHGRRKSEILAAAAPHLDLEKAVARLTELETQHIDAVVPVRGAPEFASSRAAGTWGIATSGERPAALLRLARVGIIPPAVLISAEDVKQGKPDPEVYLKAAASLGALPGECLVFEDAPAGIDSALAAGMRVIAVQTTYPREALLRAFAIVPDLQNIPAHWFSD